MINAYGRCKSGYGELRNGRVVSPMRKLFWQEIINGIVSQNIRDFDDLSSLSRKCSNAKQFYSRLSLV